MSLSTFIKNAIILGIAKLCKDSNGITSSLVGMDGVIVHSFQAETGLENEFGLLAAHDAVRKLETTNTSGPFYVGITGYGDSMANTENYMLGVLNRALQHRYGLGGLFTPGFGQSWNGAAWSFTGGASQPLTDYTYLPGANQISMPVASTAQITTGGLTYGGGVKNDGAFPDEFSYQDTFDNTVGFRTVRCFYLKRPGDGSLTFTVSQSTVSGYSPVIVDCNAVLQLAYTDITILNNAKVVTLNVAASTAACIFIGAVFLRETGVLAWSSQVGGSTMEQQKTYITNGNYITIYKPLCQALSTALFIHAQRVPGDVNWESNYVQVFNALDTIPATSQLVLGEPPRSIEDSPTVPVINEYLRKTCLSRGYAFYDQNKALGSSSAVLSSLGWGDGDGVHLDPPAWRYLAGKILKEVDWFRLGGNKLDTEPMTVPLLLKKLPKLQAMMNLRSSRVYGRSGVTMDNTTLTGGYTFTTSNAQGFILNSAAALGGAAGLMGRLVSNNPAIATSNSDFYVTLIGYRNLSLPAGVRAFTLVGINTVVTTLTTLAQRCFGVEMAKGSDVGSPGGVTGEVVRLVHSNGVTTTYGDWISAVIPGLSGTNQTGFNVSIGWNKDLQRLELWMQGNYSILVSTMIVADLATNNTASAWLNIGIVGEDAGNVPATTGNFSLIEVIANNGSAIHTLRTQDVFSQLG